MIPGKNKTTLLLLLISITLIACGGGGSGGSGDTISPSSLNYTGVTTQAVLTEENAMDLSIGSYSAGGFGSVTLEGPSSQGANASSQFSNPYRQRMLRSVRGSTLRLNVAVDFNTSQKRPLANTRNTVYGSCGGSLSVTMDVDESTGDFTGSFDYTNFCEDDIFIDGNGRIAGRANSGGAIQQFRMSFSSLALTEPEVSYVMSGWIDARLNADASETDQLDLLMRDDATGKVYWANDYTIVSGQHAGEAESTMSGRYYDPDHGYVEIRTELALCTRFDDWPYQGILMVSGRNNSWVRMSFNETGYCRLEADLEANDSIDWVYDYWFTTPSDDNMAPIAYAGNDRTVQVNTTVVLNGGTSYDPDNDPISYVWSFTYCPAGGDCPTLDDPYSSTPGFTPNRIGQYRLQLVVDDGALNSSPDTIVITATAGAPADPELLNLRWKYGIFGTNIGDTGLSALDIDNDGTVEIVVGASTEGFAANNFWYILRENTSGQYDQIWSSSPLAASIRRIIPADMDGNDLFEIYIALENGTILIFDGANYSQIDSFSTGASLSTMAIDDTDGDGDLEIITSNGANLSVFTGRDHSLLWSTTTWGGTSIAIGNVDHDASPEIVSTSGNGHGYVIDGATHSLDWDYLNGFGNLVDLGDVDGDGMEEIVGANAWYLITILDADIKTPQSEIATDLDINTLLLSDVNGDYRPEILYGDGQWGQIHCHDAVTLSELWLISNPEHGVDGMAIGDVDHDGAMEILWGAGGSSTGEDHLYIAGVQSRTIEWQSIHIDGPLSAVDVGDVDDDGRDELVMVSFESNSHYADGIVHIFDAQTHALEWRSTDLPNIIAWSGVNAVKIGDVDGDGVTEFVIATADTYDALIQIYDGPTHTLERSSIEYTGTSFTKLALGDIDSDGQVEIVVGQNVLTTGATGMHIVVFNGATAQQEWQSTSLSNSWGEITDIILSDIDEDGHIEIISSVSEGLVYAFDGITHQMDWIQQIQSTALAVHDLNRDDRPEILIGKSTGDIAVYSRNDAVFSLITTLYPSVGQSINAIGVDDLDHDGSLNIIIAGDDGLMVYDDTADRLEWSSGRLGGYLGRYNQLVSKDINGDGDREIVIGSALALYHFE